MAIENSLPNTPPPVSSVEESARDTLQGLNRERSRQFSGVTIAYLILGIGCLFFKRGDPDTSPQDFLLHGGLVLGLSIIYLIVAGLTLYYYDALTRDSVKKIPSTLEAITARAKALDIDEKEIASHMQSIQKSAGYARLIGLKISTYGEIRALRDFGRVISPLVFILVLNIGSRSATEIILLLLAAIFLWVSTSRYLKELDFLAILAD